MPNRPASYNDRVLAVGKTGSGKSELVRFLFAHMTGARRVAIDAKAELELGVQPVADPARADWSAPLLHFRPPELTREWFEELYRYIWHAGGPQTVWLDEAVSCTTGNYAPPFLRMVLQQGRSVGIGNFACTQRPQRIAPELLSECEHLYVFVRSLHPRDLDVLAVELGSTANQLDERRRALLQTQGDHAFMWYDRNADALIDCSPMALEHVGIPMLPDAERNGHTHLEAGHAEQLEPQPEQ